MAGVLKRELGIDAELQHGSYGQFKILVDGEEAIDAGAMAALGILPSNDNLVKAVKQALEKPA